MNINYVYTLKSFEFKAKVSNVKSCCLTFNNDGTSISRNSKLKKTLVTRCSSSLGVPMLKKTTFLSNLAIWYAPDQLMTHAVKGKKLFAPRHPLNGTDRSQEGLRANFTCSKQGLSLTLLTDSGIDFKGTLTGCSELSCLIILHRSI